MFSEVLTIRRWNGTTNLAAMPDSLATWCALIILLVVTPVRTVSAQVVETLPSTLEGVGVEEHAGEQLPLDLSFRDQNGQIVNLGLFFRNKRPVILTLNYSNCPMLCNLQLSGLVDGLRDVEWSAGEKFDVVSISIDPLETVERAAQTQQRYLQMYGRPGTGHGWHFLVGKQSEISRIADAIGFQYQYVRARKEYSHPAVFVVCTPEGRIARYCYGVQFPARTLELSLVEAGNGEIGTTWDRVLLFCLHYDSATGQYTPAAWKLMRLGGASTLVCLSTLVLFHLRRDRRQTRIETEHADDPIRVNRFPWSGNAEIATSVAATSSAGIPDNT